MKKIREFFLWFTTITTGILLICAIQFSLQPGAALPQNMLWHVLLSGGCTAAATTLLLPHDDCSKTRFILGIIVHFLVLCVIMVFFGTRFRWISFTVEGVLGMVFCVAFVYGFTVICTIISHKREAEEFNAALQKKYHRKDA